MACRQTIWGTIEPIVVDMTTAEGYDSCGLQLAASIAMDLIGGGLEAQRLDSDSANEWRRLMGERMRVTAHNGRAGKDGAYSPRHNDRNFNLATADHIDPERASGNWYWKWNKDVDSFEDAERLFYEMHFSDMLNARNENYIRQGHRERIQSMDSYRSNPKSCPEEIILQIGRDGQTVDAKLLQKICIDHINWRIKRYPQAKILDAALHIDEEGAPHMHVRQAWIGHDKNGRLCVGQAKALREMGIERPQPDKQENRHNNSKMTYTRECRNHLIETCRQYGLDIEEEPKEASESGLTLLEYKRRQEQTKLKDLQAELAYMDEQLIASQEDVAHLQNAAEAAQAAVDAAQKQLLALSSKLQEIDQINKQLDIAREQLADTLNMKARASEIRRPFGDRETQTYHKNMLDATRQIGSEAAQKLQMAHSAERALIARESAIKAKEKQIQTLQREIEAKLGEAEDKRQHIDDYITSRAAQIAELIIDPDDRDDSREKRMAAFMDRYQIGGKSLHSIFQDEEMDRLRKLQEKAARATREKENRHSRKRSDDISL